MARPWVGEELPAADAFAALIERRLADGEPVRALEVIQLFVADAVVAGRASWAQGVVQEVRPVVRLQVRGGTSVMTGAKAALGVLEGEARDELASVYSALERRDVASIQDSVGEARGALGSETAAMSPELRLHREWFVTWLDAEAARGDAARARGIAARLVDVGGRLARAGDPDTGLLAEVTAAELFEGARLVDDALERWIAIGQSDALATAHPSLRLAVAGRIQGWRERVRREVTAAVRDEERAAVRGELEQLEADADRREAALDVEIAALERKMAALGSAKDEERRAALDALRSTSSQQLAERASRVRELEDALVRIASAQRGASDAGAAAYSAALDDATAALEFVVVWSAARAAMRAAAG